jgi:hypothetical protein
MRHIETMVMVLNGQDLGLQPIGDVLMCRVAIWTQYQVIKDWITTFLVACYINV